MMPDNRPIFELIRPWLDETGFTPSRITALDAALADYSGLDGRHVGADAPNAGWWPNAAPAGDDRFLALFQRLAAPTAKPETVKAMARSFAEHAPRFGQDA